MISERARAYVRARATEEMTYVVIVERFTARPGYDETSLVATAGTRETIYEGHARIWEISGASTVVVGETDIDMQSVQISLPWNSNLLQKNDEIVVLASMHDPALVGKRFQVQSSAKAGELRATRRYAVMAVN